MVQLLIMVVDLLKPSRESDVGVAQGEGEEGGAKQRREEAQAQRVKTMKSLIEPCLSGVEVALREKRYTPLYVCIWCVVCGELG